MAIYYDLWREISALCLLKSMNTAMMWRARVFFIIKMIPAKKTKRQNRQKGQISNLKNKEKVDAVKKGACHPPVNLVIDLKWTCSPSLTPIYLIIIKSCFANNLFFTAKIYKIKILLFSSHFVVLNYHLTEAWQRVICC